MSKSGRSYSKKSTHRTYQAKRGNRIAKTAPDAIEYKKIEEISTVANKFKILICRRELQMFSKVA